MKKIKRHRNIYLTTAREKLGLDQKELSSLIKIHPSYYCSFETLDKFPGKKSQNKIIKYFKNQGISLNPKKAFSKILYNSYSKDDKKKNEILYNARLKIGKSQKDFAKEIGISIPSYYAIEIIKNIPNKSLQEKISNYFTLNGIDLSEEELFPKHIYTREEKINQISLNKIKQNEIPFEKNLYELIIEKEHQRKTIENIFKIIPFRNQLILKDYFGINKEEKKFTLEKIGEKQKLTKERVRQIKEEALTRLRNQKRNYILRKWL